MTMLRFKILRYIRFLEEYPFTFSNVFGSGKHSFAKLEGVLFNILTLRNFFWKEKHFDVFEKLGVLCFELRSTFLEKNQLIDEEELLNKYLRIEKSV